MDVAFAQWLKLFQRVLYGRLLAQSGPSVTALPAPQALKRCNDTWALQTAPLSTSHGNVR